LPLQSVTIRQHPGSALDGIKARVIAGFFVPLDRLISRRRWLTNAESDGSLQDTVGCLLSKRSKDSAVHARTCGRNVGEFGPAEAARLLEQAATDVRAPADQVVTGTFQPC